MADAESNESYCAKIFIESHINIYEYVPGRAILNAFYLASQWIV